MLWSDQVRGGHLDVLQEHRAAHDCLVNNAGVSVLSRGDVLDVTPESFDRCINGQVLADQVRHLDRIGLRAGAALGRVVRCRRCGGRACRWRIALCRGAGHFHRRWHAAQDILSGAGQGSIPSEVDPGRSQGQPAAASLGRWPAATPRRYSLRGASAQTRSLRSLKHARLGPSTAQPRCAARPRRPRGASSVGRPWLRRWILSLAPIDSKPRCWQNYHHEGGIDAEKACHGRQ